MGIKSTKISVLMTCYNRKSQTLASLESVFKQKLPSEMKLDVYLTDDGSTDGTSAAVSEIYPQVNILNGDGNLYWNLGMRKAFAKAIEFNYDYYLWLNDDTKLYPEALKILLETYKNLTPDQGDRIIIVGSTQDENTGAFTYGGVVRSHWWHPLKFTKIKPSSEKPIPCDTLNGNCVLIPRQVVEIIGNLDPAFTHRSGDFDYGLRAQKQGCSVWIAPGYIGSCSPNATPPTQTWHLPLLERLKAENHPKRLPPKEWKVFAQRHGGLLWPIYWLLSYRRKKSPSQATLNKN